MILKVMIPTEVVVETKVGKVIAESPEGSFCLLPRHLDIVTLLVPGLLFYQDEHGEETTIAVDEGLLVKCGPEVRVSCRNAVATGDLGAARETVRSQFHVRSEQERRARTALAKLETDIMRRLSELGGTGG